MSQAMKGLILGSPGVAGSPGIVILYGQGAPASSTDPNVAGAQLASLYLDYKNGAMYLKTALPNTWTAK